MLILTSNIVQLTSVKIVDALHSINAKSTDFNQIFVIFMNYKFNCGFTEW